jgi:hypothetical protein
MLSSFVQSPRPGQKHACHQNAEREEGNLSADISPQRQKTALVAAKRIVAAGWTRLHPYVGPPSPRSRRVREVAALPRGARDFAVFWKRVSWRDLLLAESAPHPAPRLALSCLQSAISSSTVSNSYPASRWPTNAPSDTRGRMVLVNTSTPLCRPARQR